MDRLPLIASAARPLPLRARSDLVAQPMRYQDAGCWVVKDPLSLEYFQLQPEQYRLLTLLDGRHNLEQIREGLQREFPGLRPSLKELQQAIFDLYAKGLVCSDRPGQGQVLRARCQQRRRQAAWRAVRSVLYIKLPGWDPEPFLQKLYPWTRWLFQPAALGSLLLIVLAAWLLVAVQFAEFQRRVPAFQQFFGWPNVLLLWTSMGLAKMVHELAHGLACRHFGGRCHEIGVAFLVFSPCLYCDVSDSWMLPSKWKRLAVGAAGIAAEVAISAIAIHVWWHTRPGLLHYLCLNLFLVTAITTVLFNLNPLLRYDGYYILCDWLEIPNLRIKADRMLRETFARVCLGIRLSDASASPQRRRAAFVAYSIASAGYRWFLVLSIALALYHLLKPYGLQNLGLAAGLLSALSIAGGMVWNVITLLTSPERMPVSPLRIACTTAILGGAAAVAAALPLPRHVEAPFVLEPKGAQHVYAGTPGRLIETNVRAGQHVRRGDVLVRLANFAREDQLEQLRVQRQVQEIRVAVARALDDPAAHQLAVAALKSTDEQIRDYENQLRDMTLTAPCDGVVVAAPELPAETDPEGGVLARWSGTPLDPSNGGCWLAAGTHVLSIAPVQSYEAVLVIDQADRDDIVAGQPVELKLDHDPDRTRRAVIAAISDRHLEIAPKQLSNKFGGPLPTVVGQRGEERLSGIAYQATASLPAEEGLLRPGLRGRARLAVDRRTLLDRLWLYVKHTFHFRM